MRRFRRRLLILALALVCASAAGAYWGTGAQAAVPKPTVHCLVFRFAIVGNQGVSAEPDEIDDTVLTFEAATSEQLRRGLIALAHELSYLIKDDQKPVGEVPCPRARKA